jgi:hypothetical protein
MLVSSEDWSVNVEVHPRSAKATYPPAGTTPALGNGASPLSVESDRAHPDDVLPALHAVSAKIEEICVKCVFI